MAAATAFCFDIIRVYLRKTEPVLFLHDYVVLGLPRGISLDKSYPLFVTWSTLSKSGSKRLRGCIGTFEPLPVEAGLKTYAVAAAFEDNRFPPLTKEEVYSLECCVTFLLHFERVDDPMDWTVGTHGLRITFKYNGRRKSSTYLPEVAPEQGWTKEETLDNLMNKAGFNGPPGSYKNPDLYLEIVRYQGIATRTSHGHFKEFKKTLKTIGQSQNQ
ncbi:hypothetical protein NEOLI_000473 [Neolecta irregularis DAH-3]|uniref:AMMECR1 domain-containing protein n=1 Tax=Neolecta irregularis (strain DAH-3) TaxID=1198029 RepID=A0A1U7LGT5_NEOID|nr:hypothetical protein NEOLI_000473 [Neolecta irregularis DAH-3]|eukprot:OLL21870.1 hypothetical protein NEOLI_000473 [Neolecta irregularis DAH-3]